MSFYESLQQSTQSQREYLLSAPIIQDALAGRMTVHAYRAFLQEAFHHVKHTVPLLMACGARIAHEQEWLRKAMVGYIDEEYGHEQWILDDIEACGGDREAVRRSVPNAATELMVSFVYDFIERRNPVGFLGMVNVLEGTSIQIALKAANEIQKATGLPDTALTYLRSHGELDQAHMTFFEGLVNALASPADQADVVHVAKRVYGLYGDMFRSLPAPSSQSMSETPRLQA